VSEHPEPAPGQPVPAPGQPGPGLLAPTGADAAGTPLVDVPRERWVEVAQLARDEAGMDFFDWLSAVDQPDAEPPGVDVVLHVADTSSTGGTAVGRSGVRRLILRTRVPDADLHVASLTAVWPGAAWHERETFEMFGVAFDGFDDGSGHWLRPLLLPDGFEGTPLRKAFVLAARASKPWPGAKEPGESDTHTAAPGRRKTLPPGVPDPAVWGPREAGVEPAPPQPPDAARPRGARSSEPPDATRTRGARSSEPPDATPTRAARTSEPPDAARDRPARSARHAGEGPLRAGAGPVEEPGDA
jgi:NADH-quinone oxidoreductase subunit C